MDLEPSCSHVARHHRAINSTAAAAAAAMVVVKDVGSIEMVLLEELGRLDLFFRCYGLEPLASPPVPAREHLQRAVLLVDIVQREPH